MDFDIFSDLYKDVHGVRPRGIVATPELIFNLQQDLVFDALHVMIVGEVSMFSKHAQRRRVGGNLGVKVVRLFFGKQTTTSKH